MKILLAVRNQQTVGGAESYQVSITRLLTNRGHEVAWLYENAGPEPSGSTVAHCWDAANPESWSTIRQWVPDVAYVQGLRSVDLEKRVLENWPAVLFAHQYHGACVSGTKRHFALRNTPCHRNFSAACLALYMPRRCGGLNPLTMLSLYRTEKGRANLLANYGAIVVGSSHMQRVYTELRPGPDVFLVPLGTETAPTAEPRRLSAGPRIAMVGRLTRIKGGRILVEAVARASRSLPRKLRIDVIGEGPEREAMQRAASQRGVEIEFTGWLEREAAMGRLDNADLLAVPSLWSEPFGLVGVEAAARAIPAVGFDVGGISDWLRDDLSGHIAPSEPPTASGLADAIIRALEDDDHYHALSEGALRLSTEFEMETHAGRIEEILEQAAG